MGQTASGFTVVSIPHDFRRIGLEQMVVGFHREQWREVGNIGESWVITRQRWRTHTAENQPGDQGGEGKKPLRGRLFTWPLDIRYPWSGSVVHLSQAWKTQQEPYLLAHAATAFSSSLYDNQWSVRPDLKLFCGLGSRVYTKTGA